MIICICQIYFDTYFSSYELWFGGYDWLIRPEKGFHKSNNHSAAFIKVDGKRL